MAFTAQQKFNCIIYDPVMDRRVRLKQATTSMKEFGEIHSLGTEADVTRVLQASVPIDVVFITGSLPREQFAAFVQRSKGTPQGEDAAYVIVFRSQTGSGGEIAETMMAGADGILCEPYSVDQLLSITMLAAKVRRERSDVRAQMALGLMVDDSISQLDAVAFLKASGCEPGMSLKHFKDLGEKVHNISPELLETYFDTVLKNYADAPPPRQVLKTKVYGGASSRIKNRMERKVLAEMSTRKKEE